MKWMNLALFLMQERLEQELKSVQKYRKYWNHIKKKDAQADEQTKTKWVVYVTGIYIVVLSLSCISTKCIEKIHCTKAVINE